MRIKKHRLQLGLAVLLLLAGCSLPTSSNTEETINGVPIVHIASPHVNASYAQDVPVNIQVLVTNAGDDIDRIEYTVDNEPLASVQAPNPSNAEVFSSTQTWPAETTGGHIIGVVVYQTDGTSSNPLSVQINVVAGENSGEDTGILAETPQDTGDAAPTQQPAPTEAAATDRPGPTDAAATTVPQPTEQQSEPTPETPTALFTQGINIRSGPGLSFAPPIGQFVANQTAEILATNFGGTWLKVRFGSGAGWVFADLVEIQGNIAAVPQEAGPPTPIPTTPPTNTPIPATPTPAATNNLVVVDPFINPAQPQCGQQFTVGMSIRNDGSARTSTGLSQIRIVRASDGTQIASSEGGLVAVELDPGSVHRVTVNFTVDVFINETHRVEFVADVNNQVAETNETDNIIRVDYTLPGNC